MAIKTHRRLRQTMPSTLQPLGKGIPVLTNFRFAVARYTTGGSLDTSFSTDGMLTTDFPGTTGIREEAHALAIDASGKIVVAGTAAQRFALSRYKADGTLDTAFSGGMLTTDFPAGT